MLKKTDVIAIFLEKQLMEREAQVPLDKILNGTPKGAMIRFQTMATAKLPPWIRIIQHFQLTSTYRLAVTTDQKRQQGGTTVPSTGDVDDPRPISSLELRRCQSKSACNDHTKQP